MQMIIELLMILFAFIFTVILLWSGFKSEEERHPLTPLFGGMATVFWFIAAAGISYIEYPYTVVYENSATAEAVVEHGIRAVTVNWPLSRLFWPLGFFTLFMTSILYLDKIKDWLFNRGTGYSRGGGY